MILKYDSSGNQIWSRQIGGTNDDIFRYIVIDPENNLILTGSSNSSTLDGNTNAGGYDILLAKYDTSGQKLLVKLYGTANNDYGFSVATGLNKNIYISGQTEGAFAGNTSKGKFDMFVMPLTTNGNCFLIK
ncbi:MAG: SBBP repeat-containing protein [Leptospiraceae bacterium]|nr:SBBP repeat-containing protein [Leptospiraceae bacterium]